MASAQWWSARLPSVLAVVIAIPVAGYLLFGRTQYHPSGWATSAVDAGNYAVMGLAGVIVVFSVLGMGLSFLEQPLYTGGMAGFLFIIGGVGIAIGPQIWLVGSLLLISAILVRSLDEENDHPSRLLVLALLVLLFIGAILALTALTTSVFPQTTNALATLIFAGTGLAIAITGQWGHQRVTVLLLAGVIAGGVIVTGAAIAVEAGVFSAPAGPAYLGGVEVINGDDEAHEFDVEILRDGERVFADSFRLQGSPPSGANSMPITRTWGREPATFVVRVRTDGGEWNEIPIPTEGADCYAVGRFIPRSGDPEWLVQSDHEWYC